MSTTGMLPRYSETQAMLWFPKETKAEFRFDKFSNVQGSPRSCSRLSEYMQTFFVIRTETCDRSRAKPTITTNTNTTNITNITTISSFFSHRSARLSPTLSTYKKTHAHTHLRVSQTGLYLLAALSYPCEVKNAFSNFSHAKLSLVKSPLHSTDLDS